MPPVLCALVTFRARVLYFLPRLPGLRPSYSCFPDCWGDRHVPPYPAIGWDQVWLGCLWTAILPISASQVAGITRISHHVWLEHTTYWPLLGWLNDISSEWLLTTFLKCQPFSLLNHLLLHCSIFFSSLYLLPSETYLFFCVYFIFYLPPFPLHEMILGGLACFVHCWISGSKYLLTK
jgi:hypothetical protein